MPEMSDGCGHPANAPGVHAQYDFTFGALIATVNCQAKRSREHDFAWPRSSLCVHTVSRFIHNLHSLPPNVARACSQKISTCLEAAPSSRNMPRGPMGLTPATRKKALRKADDRARAPRMRGMRRQDGVGHGTCRRCGRFDQV